MNLDSDMGLELALAFYEDAENSYANEEYEEAYGSFIRALKLFRKLLVSAEFQHTQDEKIDHMFFVGDKFMFAIACNLSITENRESGYFFQRSEDLVKNFNRIISKLSEIKDHLSSEKKERLAEFIQTARGFRIALEELSSRCPRIPTEKHTTDEVQEILDEMLNLKVSLLYSNSGSDSSCFIATAAYGNSEHPDLNTFRSFRDQSLLTNSAGKQIVELYYKIGPFLAYFVKKHPLVQTVTRIHLEKLARRLRN